MPTLSGIAAAERHHVAPKTLKAWHRAGRVSALSVGRRGVSWLFDAETLDREVARLPRCAYAGCDRPVAEQGEPCKDHRLARYLECEDEETRRTRVGRSAKTLRKHEDRDYYCEQEACENKLRVTSGDHIASRRRRLAKRPDGDTRVLCASCAAKRRHQEKPYSKGRWRLCPSCGEGPDWWQPWQEERFTHCARCFQSAPDVREQRRAARLDFLETPEGQEAHRRALVGAQAFQTASTAALPAEGLVPLKAAAGMLAPYLHYSPATLVHALPAERRQFGGLVRLGVKANDLLEAAPDGAARQELGRKLNKPLSKLKGTSFGRTPVDTLRPGTNARILEMHATGASLRSIAAEVGVGKSTVARVVNAA